MYLTLDRIAGSFDFGLSESKIWRRSVNLRKLVSFFAVLKQLPIVDSLSPKSRRTFGAGKSR